MKIDLRLPTFRARPAATRLPLAAACMAAALALGGCVTMDGDTVSAYETGRMSTVVDATVIQVRPVTIDGSQSGIGGVSGGVIGSVAGSQIGGWREGMIGGVIGAVAGAVVGNAVERGTTRSAGDEIVVQLRNGERRAIVQARGNDAFVPGDPVVLVYSGSRVRIQRNTLSLPPPTPAAPPTMAPARSG